MNVLNSSLINLRITQQFLANSDHKSLDFQVSKSYSAITCHKSVAHQNFSFRDPLAFSNYGYKEELVMYHHLHIRLCSIKEMLIFLHSLLKAERLNQVGIFINKPESGEVCIWIR